MKGRAAFIESSEFDWSKAQLSCDRRDSCAGNVDDYTRYLSTILAGLSIQAANGSTKAQLRADRRDGAPVLGVIRVSPR
jgi:hypothetical protein